MCDNQHSKEEQTMNESHQLTDAASVKQEPHIKEEPRHVGDLAEAPQLNHCDNEHEQSSIDLGQSGNDDAIIFRLMKSKWRLGMKQA